MGINSGDTAWVLASTALVLVMTPALGIFYGGLVRRKNVLSTVMHSFISIAVVSLLWVIVGYSLAFGPDISGVIGGLDWAGLRDVGLDANPDYAPTIPHQTFMIFQGMFAIITPALITGAFAERMRFKAFLLFTSLWSLLVYAPIAHWVWGTDGWLREIGVLDFAGGAVVHLSAGVAAIVAAMVLGQRRGFGEEPMDPHSLTLTVFGAGLLWVGWFGFNGGSALAANGLASNAIVVSNISAAAGAMTWLGLNWSRHGQPSVLCAAAGGLAGLVAATPASGFVSPMTAIYIGIGSGVISYAGVTLVKNILDIDDSLDVFAVHGLCGAWGLLATGLFADKAINAAGDDGVFHGNLAQLGEQLLAIGVVTVFSGVMTYAILRVIHAVAGLRVTERDEATGLDVSQHGELGYTLGLMD